MKAIKHNSKAVLFLLCLNISACTDFLTLTPTDSLVPETYYKDANDAYRSLIGIYQVAKQQRVEGSQVVVPCMLNQMSDETYVGGGSATDGGGMQELSKFNAISGNNIVRLIWLNAYEGIQRANTLLINYDNINFKDSEASERKNYKAETLFLRAHFYFKLVKFFERIPLLLEDFDSENWKEVRQEEPDIVYAQIAADMLRAIPDMASEGIEKGRFLSWAAKAELVKVYMYYTGYYGKTSLPVTGREDFTKTEAIEMLEDIITNSGCSLLPDYSKLFQFTSDYSPNYNQESIFEIPYANNGYADWDDAVVGNLMNTLAGPRGLTGSSILKGGWGMDLPSRELMEDVFDYPGDARKEATFITAKKLLAESPDIRLEASYCHTGGYNYKYTCWPSHRAAVGAWALNWEQNYVYIRLADVYLMAAELYLDVDKTKSKLYLDKVRTRAGLAPISTANIDINTIYKERQKELALEGHRYWDVLRRGLDYAKQSLDISNYQPKANATEPLIGEIGSPSDFEVSFDKKKRGLLPIPLQEVDRNPAFDQNEGYD